MMTRIRELAGIVVGDPRGFVGGLARRLWDALDSRLHVRSQWSVLASTIQLPAEAGEGRRAKLWLGAAATLMVLVVAVGVRALLPGSDPLAQLDTPLMCLDCGRSKFIRLEPGQSRPPCASCGKARLAPACKCGKCGRYLVLNEYRGMESPTICKACGAEVRHGE